MTKESRTKKKRQDRRGAEKLGKQIKRAFATERNRERKKSDRV